MSAYLLVREDEPGIYELLPEVPGTLNTGWVVVGPVAIRIVADDPDAVTIEAFANGNEDKPIGSRLHIPFARARQLGGITYREARRGADDNGA
jgi:hypothetical protein